MNNESVDVTNIIRQQRGKPPINPHIIEGFEGPSPPAVTMPSMEPIVDLDDDDPIPDNAVRLSTRELIGATTAKPMLQPEPELLILDREARHLDRSVTLSDQAMNRIKAIVIGEMHARMKEELKALQASMPKRAYVKREKKPAKMAKK